MKLNDFNEWNRMELNKTEQSCLDFKIEEQNVSNFIWE